MLSSESRTLLATCAALLIGCASNPEPQTSTSPATGTPGPGAMDTPTPDDDMPNPGPKDQGTGSDDPMQVSDDGTVPDDAAVAPVDPGCEDDPNTLGNDCAGVTTCSGSISSCSLTSQNCCVTAYAEDGTSCNEGSSCDGLATAACDGPEDCTDGQQCCISVSVGLGVDIKHRCVADQSQCTGGLIVNRILCHSEDDCSLGEDCVPIPNFPWWGQCKQ